LLSRPYHFTTYLCLELRSQYAKASSVSKGGFCGVGERKRDRFHGLVGKSYVNQERKEGWASETFESLMLRSWLSGDGVVSLTRMGGGRSVWTQSMAGNSIPLKHQ